MGRDKEITMGLENGYARRVTGSVCPETAVATATTNDTTEDVC